MNKPPVLCKKHNVVINPAPVSFGGPDVDVEWLEKVECNEDCPKWSNDE